MSALTSNTNAATGAAMDAATAQTLLSTTKRCPSCHAPTEKTGGCDTMTCLCGKEWCWRCSALLHTSQPAHQCEFVIDVDACYQAVRHQETRQRDRIDLDTDSITAYNYQGNANSCNSCLIQFIMFAIIGCVFWVFVDASKSGK